MVDLEDVSNLPYEIIGGSYEKNDNYYKYIVEKEDKLYKIIGEEKITYDEYDAIKLLKKSPCVSQRNNYTILKIPEFHNYAGWHIPIDYDIHNIILNLWSLGMETFGSDQGYNGYRGYIGIRRYLVNSEESALSLLKKTFGKENIRICRILTKYKDTTLTDRQKYDLINKDKKLYSNKIHLIIDRGIRMSFEHKNVPFINCLFKDDIKSNYKCYKGGVFKINWKKRYNL